MKEKRKKIKYSDKIVIADDASLRYLYKIDKLYYLNLLFSQVYITETLKKKCKFKIPSWMIIKESNYNLKKLISNAVANIDKFEIAAIALVLALKISQSDNIIESIPSLILVDKKMKNEKMIKKASIYSINLIDVFKLAYYKNIFTKDEGKEIFNKLKKLGRVFSKNDINNIYSKKI
jgi:predicted nucleic acid-binding protein